MKVCGACGVWPNPEESKPSCASCAAPVSSERELEAAERWACVDGLAQCRKCGLRSPVRELPSDGSVGCIHCGARVPVDLEAWKEALDEGHNACDVARGDAPLEAYPDTSDEDLDVVLRPGVPLCRTCKAPLDIQVAEDKTTAACSACDTVAEYHRPDPLVVGRTVRAVLGDSLRVESEARASENQAATALTCPSCEASLPDATGHVVRCAYCKTASRVPLRVLLRINEADPLWVLYQGDSDVVRRLAAAKKQEAARAAARAHNREESDARKKKQAKRSTYVGLAVIGVVVVGMLGYMIGWSAWHERQCERGDAKDCFDLAWSAEYDKPSNPEKAVSLYQRACDLGHGPACTAMGNAYRTSWGGVRGNPRTAASYYARGCRAGDTFACSK